jgi:hypothetical protein
VTLDVLTDGLDTLVESHGQAADTLERLMLIDCAVDYQTGNGLGDQLSCLQFGAQIFVSIL